MAVMPSPRAHSWWSEPLAGVGRGLRGAVPGLTHRGDRASRVVQGEPALVDASATASRSEAVAGWAQGCSSGRAGADRRPEAG